MRAMVGKEPWEKTARMIRIHLHCEGFIKIMIKIHLIHYENDGVSIRYFFIFPAGTASFMLTKNFLHAKPPPLPHRSLEQNDFEEKEFIGAWKQTGAAVSHDPKVAECQRQILEARAMVEEAKRSLGINVDGIEDGDAFLEKENEEIDRNEERVESIKAALISTLVSTLVGLSIFLTQATSSSKLILPLTINFINCALFGITFQYPIRRDLDNIQLKTGTSTAFGFVKGLAMLGSGPPLELNTGSFLSHAFDGAVYVSENLFLFVFAFVGLDYCLR